jgi:hypothetical protein
MTLFDQFGRPVVRRDDDPASPDAQFLTTAADADLTQERVVTDNAVVTRQLSAGVLELIVRQFGDGVGAANRRKRGLVPKFLAGEQTFVLMGSGDRDTFSVPLDDTLDDAQGTIAFRGQSLWRPLGPSAASFLLKTLGVDADPVWAISPGAIPLRARFIEGSGTTAAAGFDVLAGTSYLDIILVGSGGGGGQANASTAGNLSVGNAGGGGAALRHIITAPISGYIYSLGAYGGNAAQGTVSTVTIPGVGDLTANGGGAGSTIGNSNTVTAAGHTNGASVATGGNVWNRGGKASGKTIRLSGAVAVAGHGGASPGWGTGGTGRTTTGVGEIGHGHGGGGSGGLAINGAGSQAGGHGAPALLILVEYASAT